MDILRNYSDSTEHPVFLFYKLGDVIDKWIFFLKKALWTFGLQSQTAVNFELESFLNSVETRLSVYRTG